MKVKCVSCGWEYNFEDFELDWKECPECGFPYRLTEWIEDLYNRISELERENTRLATKLTGAFND